MITWDDFISLIRSLIVPSLEVKISIEFKFAHPLDPARLILPPSEKPELPKNNPDRPFPTNPSLTSEEVAKQLEQVITTVGRDVADLKEDGAFWVGRLAFLPELVKQAGPSWRYLTINGESFWARLQQEVILATFPNATELSLLSLFVGPVQEFIMEARKVRDLWTGSYLLAAASFHALTPILQRYGPDVIIHPHLHEADLLYKWVRKQWPNTLLPQAPGHIQRLASVPNRALAVVPTAAVEELGSDALSELKGYWQGLSAQVWNRLPSGMKSKFDRHDWDKQIADHFHIYYTAVPITRDALQNDYPNANHAAQEFFEARKLTRSFACWPAGASKRKCTLCIHREIMGPDDRTFWPEMVEQSQGILRPGEQLCAVCLTKRYLRHCDLEVPRDTFDSTSDLAVFGFRQKIKQLKETEYHDYWEAISLVYNLVREPKEPITIDDIPGERFYRENLVPDRFIQDEARSLKGKPEEKHLNLFLSSAADGLKSLEEKIGKAPKYYAILQMDGDDMGKWMSGNKPDPARFPLTLTRHSALSQILTALGRNVMPRLVGEWKGVLVYSGGDDLLAMGTVAGVLDLANRLRRAFRDGLPDEGWVGLTPQAGISAGLVLVHYNDSLEKALEEARGAAEQAKKLPGKDALVVTIRYSSGNYVSGGYKWDIRLQSKDAKIPLTDFLGTLAAWVAQADRGLSPRFIYRLMENLEIFYIPRGRQQLVREPFAAEVKRLLARHLPKDSPIRLVTYPFSPDDLVELLVFLAEPEIPGNLRPPDFNKKENLMGLLKVAQFLAREKAV